MNLIKKILSIFLFFTINFAFANKIINDCKVYNVHDGDSINCKANGKKYRVRLAGIDAPEINQEYGINARNELRKKILNKNVNLEIVDIDRYKRYVAQVYLNNININDIMVAEGNAWVYREYLYHNYALSLENNARKKRLGLWKKQNPTYPQTWRKNNNKNNRNKIKIYYKY